MRLTFSLPSYRVEKTLKRLINQRVSLYSNSGDNGPEYISNSLKLWAKKEIRYNYGIFTWNPQQNGYVERFNRTMRYELLEQNLFDSLDDIRLQSTRWLWDYNNIRPHMALGGFLLEW